MSEGGTASYESIPDGLVVPDLTLRAVANANELGFPFCVRPEIGRLLASLAAGLPAGSTVGETGTGTGAGLGWLVSAAGPDVSFVSYERDQARAAAAQQLFAGHQNVEVVHGDAAGLFDDRRFDLLVLDGGPGSGKGPGAVPVDPSSVLNPGGTITIDDFTPMVSWPPMFEGAVDDSRVHWVQHPDLHATEVRVAPDLAVVVGRYLPG